MNNNLLHKIYKIYQLHTYCKYYIVYEIPTSNNIWGCFTLRNSMQYTTSETSIEKQIFYSINNELPERIKNLQCVEKYAFCRDEYDDIGKLRYINDINQFGEKCIDKFFMYDYKVIACFDNMTDYAKAKMIVNFTDCYVM